MLVPVPALRTVVLLFFFRVEAFVRNGERGGIGLLSFCVCVFVLLVMLAGVL
jgi:hypothetical protein